MASVCIESGRTSPRSTMMLRRHDLRHRLSAILHAWGALGAGGVIGVVVASGCWNEGPRIKALPQSIGFTSVPTPGAGDTSVTVVVHASSGLPVVLSSQTPTLCAVSSVTGIVTAFGSGTCTIAASQAGNDDYAPAPVVTVEIGFDFKDRGFAFATVPALSEYDIGTITATDGAGSAVMYATSTPSVCSIDPDAGIVTTLSTGDCAIVAHAGTQQIDQTIAVTAPAIPTTPGTPTAVQVTAGDSVDQVLVNVGATTSGGLPLNAFIVDSVPSGVHAVGAARQSRYAATELVSAMPSP